MSSLGNVKTEKLQADVVVIGGGGAGLAAAVSARENRANKVILLESVSRPGGNTIFATFMFAYESPAQRRLGIKSSKNEAFRQLMDYARWSLDPKIVRVLADKAGEIVGWLEDKGAKFDIVSGNLHASIERDYTSKTLKAGVGMSARGLGRNIFETLLRESQKLDVQLICKAPAKKILTDTEGKVKGVLAKTGDKELEISTKSVIIAAGAFSGSREMLKKYFPYYFKDDIYSLGVSSVKGDGLKMAKELGAVADYKLEICVISPHYHPFTLSVHEALRRPDVMRVNINGERYIDESYIIRDGSGDIDAATDQPGGIVYALLDSKSKEHIQAHSYHEDALSIPGFEIDMSNLYEDIKKDVTTKRTCVADSWDEIAKYIGAKPQILKATVERYNSFCDSGYDADFAKDKQFLQPLRNPPYYAILGRRGYDHTRGGIKINHRMEAINKQGKTIGGLYAAGDNAGGWSVPGRVNARDSSGLTWAICSGYIAGENAAKYAMGRA